MKFWILLFVVSAWGGEKGNSLLEGQAWAPLREQAIIVAEGGYFPSHLSLFTGERLRLFITNTLEEESCLIMVDPHHLFLAAHKGSVASGEVTFTLPGSYSFYCPSSKNFNGKITGTITVLERKKKSKRTPAGMSDKKVWMPREN